VKTKTCEVDGLYTGTTVAGRGKEDRRGDVKGVSVWSRYSVGNIGGELREWGISGKEALYCLLFFKPENVRSSLPHLIVFCVPAALIQEHLLCWVLTLKTRLRKRPFCRKKFKGKRI